MIFGFFLGAILAIWLLSAILTLILEKLIKKETNRNTTIITTIIAGSIYLLFGNWNSSEWGTIFILTVIAVLILIWGRLEIIKKKLEQKQLIKETIKRTEGRIPLDVPTTKSLFVIIKWIIILIVSLIIIGVLSVIIERTIKSPLEKCLERCDEIYCKPGGIRCWVKPEFIQCTDECAERYKE